MTKKTKVLISVCLVVLLCLLSACRSDTPQTAEGFTKVMEENGFEVQDYTEDTDVNNLSETVLVATNENYEVEFYVLNDVETADGVFNNIYDLFMTEHSVTMMSQETIMSGRNYYSFTADDDFYIVSQIENTMVYCEVSSDYKEEVVGILEVLGYK